MIALKPPIDSFAINIPIENISFLHPGYPDNQNVLLTLPAVDKIDGTHGVLHGIHHETARIACAILANCNWEGYFCAARDGSRVDAGPDELLSGKAYYFYIDGDPDYAVVPSIDHFQFPNLRGLPQSWSGSSTQPPDTANSPKPRDVTCRISNSSLPNETAHVIPSAEEDWWQRNNMFLYATNPTGNTPDIVDNTITLRRDLHWLWDAQRFTLVPKAGKWVVHVLDHLFTNELEVRYHNQIVQPIMRVAREFLLARFAIAILRTKSMFARLGAGPLKLVIYDAETNSYGVRNMSFKERLQRFGPISSQSKSRSASPRKKKRAADQDGDVPDDLNMLLDEQQDQWGVIGSARPKKRLRRSPSFQTDDWFRGDATSDLDSTDGDEWQERGRPRRRRCSNSHSPSGSTGRNMDHSGTLIHAAAVPAVSPVSSSSPMNMSFTSTGSGAIAQVSAVDSVIITSHDHPGEDNVRDRTAEDKTIMGDDNETKTAAVAAMADGHRSETGNGQPDR
ncbi:hypothetical protein VM1G_08105 [Cytospora mali]|uniref:HNH nuclease domain-containing protein n=1 Tax=Cytospora mali TaxID=578113 RepID=A0A194W892_CYTMA|nr:hypothetical protein VM1G_08105 [Valsa mali]